MTHPRVRPIAAALTTLGLAAALVPATAGGSVARAETGARAAPAVVPAPHSEAADAALAALGEHGYDDWRITPYVAVLAGAGTTTVQPTAAALDAFRSDLVANGLPRYYTFYSPVDAAYTADGIEAGDAAQMLVAVIGYEMDPRDAGGQDVVDTVERTVTDGGPSSGRIVDQATKHGQPYEGEVLTEDQAFAVRGLVLSGSDRAAQVRDFMLRQQCDGGFFRRALADRAAADQSCPPDAEPDPDAVGTTARVVSLLADLAESDPLIAASVADASAWLAAHPASGDSVTEDALRGWALGLTGRVDQARAAAVRVRRLQFNGTRCDGQVRDQAGYVASTAADLRREIDAGPTVPDGISWGIETAYSYPVLAWAPAASEPLRVSAPRRVRAGHRFQVTVRGVAAGARGCVSVPGSNRSLVGSGETRTVWIRAPRRTGVKMVRLAILGQSVTRSITVRK